MGSKCRRTILTPRRACSVMTLWSVFALVFVAAILVIEGSFWLAFDLRNSQKAVNRRLAQRGTSLVKAGPLNLLRDKQDAHHSNWSGLADVLAQTGLKLSWPTLGLCAGASLVLAATPWWFGFNVLIWAPASVGGGPALVALHLMMARRRR